MGGLIYQKAVERDPSFITIVWLTGVAKVCGGILLLLNLREWSKITKRIVVLLTLISGVFLFFYGFANMLTLALSSIGLLSLQIDSLALKWRLIFWEPFFMIGGVLFILSALRSKKRTFK